MYVAGSGAEEQDYVESRQYDICVSLSITARLSNPEHSHLQYLVCATKIRCHSTECYYYRYYYSHRMNAQSSGWKKSRKKHLVVLWRAAQALDAGWGHPPAVPPPTGDLSLWRGCGGALSAGTVDYVPDILCEDYKSNQMITVSLAGPTACILCYM